MTHVIFSVGRDASRRTDTNRSGVKRHLCLTSCVNLKTKHFRIGTIHPIGFQLEPDVFRPWSYSRAVQYLSQQITFGVLGNKVTSRVFFYHVRNRGKRGRVGVKVSKRSRKKTRVVLPLTSIGKYLSRGISIWRCETAHAPRSGPVRGAASVRSTGGRCAGAHVRCAGAWRAWWPAGWTCWRACARGARLPRRWGGSPSLEIFFFILKINKKRSRFHEIQLQAYFN